MIYMFLSNNPSSGDINSSNLSCSNIFCNLNIIKGLWLQLSYAESLTYNNTLLLDIEGFKLSTGFLRVVMFKAEYVRR